MCVHVEVFVSVCMCVRVQILTEYGSESRSNSTSNGLEAVKVWQVHMCVCVFLFKYIRTYEVQDWNFRMNTCSYGMVVYNMSVPLVQFHQVAFLIVYICRRLSLTNIMPRTLGFNTDIFARLEGGAMHFEMSAHMQQFING